MKKKALSAVLSAILAAGTIGSFTVTAEEDPVLYTYTNEAGETINITQSMINAEHWNTDVLGDTAPAVYEDFPMIMAPYVDDFANLSLELRYLKNVDEGDSSILTITDMATGQTVYSEDLGGSVFYTDELAMDKYFKITITEQFEGEESTTYTRYISTSNEAAEMPDYVLNPTAEDTETIYIIDTEKYDLATTINEDGSISFDADIAALTDVPANEWDAYLDTLEPDKLYKVETDGSGSTQTGFISTYEGGEDLGIFMPGYTIYNTDVSSLPMQMSNFSTSSISENIVTRSQEIYGTGDQLFSAGTNNYVVLQYVLTDDDWATDIFDVWINASLPLYVQTWYKRPSDSKVNRIYSDSYYRSGNRHVETEFYFNGEELETGDIVYFVIYNPTYKGIEGSICIQNKYFDDVDDESGSSYEQYSNNNSISYATYSPGYNTNAIWNQYGITRHMDFYWDVDAFYLNNTSDNGDSYDIVFNNTGVLNEDDEQDGTSLRINLYYVDFDYDSHFILKKQSSLMLKAVDEDRGYTGVGSISFAPKNEDTKYFISAEATAAEFSYDSAYSFYVMLYPNS